MNSQFVVLAVVLLCGTLSVNGSPALALAQSKSDKILLNYMLQSKAADSAQPNSMVCFNDYLQTSDQIRETFETNYQACITTAKTQLEALVLLGNETRVNITEISDGVCEQFTLCNEYAANVDYFDCFSNLGDQSVRQIYSASQDASEAAAHYREQYRTIEANEESCTNNTERVYVTDTAEAFKVLQDCLNGSPPATAAPATEAPATEAPATEAPATEAPGTEAPATEAPATEAPATEAPATEAPATEAPATEAPATEAPATEAPATEAPATEAPATEAPATEAPATEAPATEAPATEAPATEAPATEAPAGTTEADQVEEVSARLQNLVRSWGKRFI